MLHHEKYYRAQFCGIDNKYIDYIADQRKKIGKFTPGTHIPIKDIKYFRKNCRHSILNSGIIKKYLKNIDLGKKVVNGFHMSNKSKIVFLVATADLLKF